MGTERERQELVAAARRRSRAVGREPGMPLEARQVTGEELDRRLHASRALISVAARHLAWLSSFSLRLAHTLALADREGVLLLVNGSPADVLQRGPALPGCVWSERELGPNGIGTCLAENRPLCLRGVEHFAPSLQPFCCAAAPIRSPSGGLVGAIGLSTLQEDGCEDRLDLVTYVASVIEQELAAREAAREAARNADSLRVMARLSAFAAHELATPLSALAHSLELLSNQALDEKARRVTERCRRLCGQAEEVVAGLRLLGGANPPREERVDLAALAREALAAQHLPDEFDAVVEVEPAGAAVVPGNSRLLRHALRNLIRNAVEAMPRGGTVGVCVRPGPEQVRLTVWDDGPGLPPQVRDRLFQDPVTTKPSGSGLGLLLVRTVVERVHGGRVSFEPGEGSGALFHLDLPTERPATALLPAAPTSPH